MDEKYIHRSTLVNRGWRPQLIDAFCPRESADKIYPNPICKRMTYYLYNEERIEKLENENPIVREAIEKYKNRSILKPQDFTEILEKRYRDDPHKLENDAFEFMFNLIRYVNSGMCRRDIRNEIFMLKDAFLEKAYHSRYLTAVESYYQVHEKKYCYHCGGDGFDDDGKSCKHCGGTGIDRLRERHKVICFRFDIEGKTYSFLSPIKRVHFPFSITRNRSTEIEQQEGKPLSILASKLKFARETVRFYINRANPLPFAP